MGIVLRNEDGSYRNILDVFLDISEAMNKIKEELDNEDNYSRIL